MSESTRFLLVKPIIHLIGWCIFLSFFSFPVFAAPALVLEEGRGKYTLGRHLETLEDPTRMLTINDVRTAESAKKFMPSASERPNFGLTESAYWLKFQVTNPDARPRRMLLENHAVYESLELYSFSGAESKGASSSEDGYTIQKKDAFTLIREHRARWELFAFELKLDARETRTYYLRAAGVVALQTVLNLWEPESLRESSLKEYYTFGLYFGLMGILALYNFFLYLRIHDPAYLYYVLFLLCFIFFRMEANWWYTIYWFSFAPEWNYYAVWLSIQLAFIFSLFFFREILQSADYLPRLHQFSNVMIGINLFGIILMFAMDPRDFVWFAPLMAFFVFPLLFAMAVVCWLMKVRTARFLMLGWGVFMGLTLIYSMKIMGVVPGNFFTGYAIEIGSGVEVLLFSLALADRFNQIHSEKELAQSQALENLRRADALKDQLLANTSHELKTPIHGMVGLVESILDSSKEILSQNVSEKLRMVVSSGKRLNLLVNDLLDLSALSNREIRLHLEPVALAPIVKSVIHILEPLLSGKPLHCFNQIPDTLPHVLGDSGRLQQILLNLVDNAVKYTDSGSIAISARLETDKALIEVSDTGPGISPEQTERIFRSFERGKAAGIVRQKGLGLGLAICRRLVDAHGSTLEVRSTPGEGSVFYFTLPLAAGSAETDVSSFAPVTSQTPIIPHPLAPTAGLSPHKDIHENKRGHVLIVDDDPVNLQVVVGYLEETGYAFSTCLSGQEALESLKAGFQFDLVLLDVMMPGLDGYEVCELIREEHPADKLPVLLLTALTRDEDIAQGFQSGANDYLTKPFHKKELLSRVKAHLELALFNRQSESAASAVNIARRALVETLRMALTCWEETTAKTFIDLAQETGLWGAYLDKSTGTWRSQSLSRYQSIKTLPAKPRWRKVIKTVKYVLEKCPPGSKHHERLASQLSLITQLLQKTPL